MRARVVQAAADFGLLLSNFRPGSIIAWLSANTSSEPTWTTTYIVYTAAVRGRSTENISAAVCGTRKRIVVYSTVLWRGGGRFDQSAAAEEDDWYERMWTRSRVRIIMIHHRYFLYMRVLDVYTCVEGAVLTLDIVFKFQVLMY